MKALRMTVMMVFAVTGLCLGAAEQQADAKVKPVASTPPAMKGGGNGVWTQDIDAAKELAKEKGLPLFLNFTGSDWCGWCMLMDRQVFSTAEWKRYAKDSLVLVTIDFPKNERLVPKKYVERNQALAKTYRVSGYPTYVLLSSDGQKTLGRFGASEDATPQKFISGIKDATKSELLARLGDADKAAYDDLMKERANVHDEFQKCIDAIYKKIDALLDKRKE